jgi:NADPH2:quinone reductase
MTGTMKAVVAEGYGTPDVLTVKDMPIPRPGAGQIQVRVSATALNPADLRTLSGVLREMAPLEFPHIPGIDFAGTVTQIGEEVTRFAVGDQVFGLGLPRATAAMATLVSSPPSLTTGTMAEYAVFDADTPGLALRPADLDAEHAATLAISGLTALSLLQAGGFQPGETVLVIGATGGVGSTAVPLLAAAKTHVIATASPADEQYVRDLGANEVIDHHAGDAITETLRRHPTGIDAIVNLALAGDDLIDAGRAIRPGGRLLNIAYPSPDPGDFARDDLTVETIFSVAHPGDLEELAARAIDGTLPAAISHRYRLDDGAHAYQDLVDKHTRGKLIVLIDQQT